MTRSQIKIILSGKLKRAVKNKNMEINAAMEFQNGVKKESQGLNFQRGNLVTLRLSSDRSHLKMVKILKK